VLNAWVKTSRVTEKKKFQALLFNSLKADCFIIPNSLLCRSSLNVLFCTHFSLDSWPSMTAADGSTILWHINTKHEIRYLPNQLAHTYTECFCAFINVICLLCICLSQTNQFSIYIWFLFFWDGSGGVVKWTHYSNSNNQAHSSASIAFIWGEGFCWVRKMCKVLKNNACGSVRRLVKEKVGQPHRGWGYVAFCSEI